MGNAAILAFLNSLVLALVCVQRSMCDPEDDNSTSVDCPGGCKIDFNQSTVSCVSSDCTVFPESLIPSTGVQHLDVSFNRITSVPALRCDEWISLDLSNNAITQIEADTFGHCQQLVRLNLSANVLTTLTKHMFGTGPTGLVQLDLSYNRISTIEAFSFQFLPELLSLNLSHNYLETIEANAFFSSDLQTLHLEGNRLTAVRPEYFNDLRQMKYLSLRTNKIEMIEADSFALLDNMELLDLGENKLKDLRKGFFRESLRIPFSRLRDIYLDRNELQTIHDNTFVPFPNLRFISLDDNELADIGSIEPFPQSLARISIQNNAQLKTIRNGTFTDLKQLKRVNMSACYKLRTIEAGAFDEEESSVTEFDVSHCSLDHLSANLLNWTKLTVLLVADNQWNCDCKLNWTKSTLPEAVLKTMTCSSPHKLKDQSLFDVDINNMLCDFYTRYGYSISIGLILIATIIFVSAVIMLSSRYRNHVCRSCSKKSRGYNTLYRVSPDAEDDCSDPAVSIQITDNCKDKLLKDGQPTAV